jgi:GH25 family lysozyme M1 (1,4-beta-N-acetylmuramidase)
MKLIKGIDVSENNGFVDWQAVADAGIKFAIVRSSYGRNSRDENFLRNVEGAHSVGLKCGAYHYSYALTPEQAVREAQNCKQAIDEAGVLLELPVWFDMEDADGYKRRYDFDFSAENVTAICKAFLDEIKPLDCGVYASLSWLENYIDWQSLGCAVWNAQWGAQDDLQGYLWQFTDSLNINGKVFDGNWLYLDHF